MAGALGVSRQAVLKWCGRGIPPDRIDDVMSKFPRVNFKGAIGRGRGVR